MDLEYLGTKRKLRCGAEVDDYRDVETGKLFGRVVGEKNPQIGEIIHVESMNIAVWHLIDEEYEEFGYL